MHLVVFLSIYMLFLSLEGSCVFDMGAMLKEFSCTELYKRRNVYIWFPEPSKGETRSRSPPIPDDVIIGVIVSVKTYLADAGLS